jgi:aspartate/methionine/tyrosine aminotransferase
MPRFALRTSWNLELNSLARLLERRRAAGLPTLDLTESNPTRCGFTYDRLVLEAPSYDPHPRGLAEARRAIAEYYNGVVLPEQVILTSGSSEAYSHLFRLLADPGDRVLVPAPSYPLFEFLARLNDIELAEYRLEPHRRWEIDFGSLEAAVTPRTRAVVVVHPNNPTGSFLGSRERQELTEFCGRHGLVLIADEVFLDYRVEGAAASFAGESPVLALVLNGLSKTCGLPQMKLGWITVSGPDAWRDAALNRLEVIADTYLSVATPIQRALAGLLAARDRIQTQILDRIRCNLCLLDDLLAGQSLCTRLPVEGGWSVVLRVPRVRTDEEWALELLDRDGVLLHPGHFFSFDREGYLVASLIVPADAFAEGIRRLLARVTSSTAKQAGSASPAPPPYR